MQELPIATTEALTIAREARRWHWRVPITRMMIEHGGPTRLDIMPSGFKSIVEALLLDCLVVECRRRRRGVINRLRVRATRKHRGNQQRSETESFLHINSSCVTAIYPVRHSLGTEVAMIAVEVLRVCTTSAGERDSPIKR
jgi:hypothetical protein